MAKAVKSKRPQIGVTVSPEIFDKIQKDMKLLRRGASSIVEEALEAWYKETDK